MARLKIAKIDRDEKQKPKVSATVPTTTVAAETKTSSTTTETTSRGPANSRQVAGNHYRKVDGEQHWDRMWRLHGPGYFVGSITKYVERYQDKHGVIDLEKARHFLDKLIELERAKMLKILEEQQEEEEEEE